MTNLNISENSSTKTMKNMNTNDSVSATSRSSGGSDIKMMRRKVLQPKVIADEDVFCNLKATWRDYVMRDKYNDEGKGGVTALRGENSEGAVQKEAAVQK